MYYKARLTKKKSAFAIQGFGQQRESTMAAERITKCKWGRIANILMDRVETENGDEPPTVNFHPMYNTPHTAKWQRDLELFHELQTILEDNPEMKKASTVFLEKMENLRDILIQASKGLTQEEQENGKLIERRPEYKTCLDEAWKLFDESLKKAATKLGLKKEEDSWGKLQKNIKEMKDPLDRCGHLRFTATFTSIIRHTRYLRANVKALHKVAKKMQNTKVGSSDSTKYLKFAGKVIFQTDQFKVGERLVEAIASAEKQQEERQIVQDTYESHRRNLDRFAGEGRGENTIHLSVDERLRINKTLNDAGCNHLFDTELDKECEIMKDEEVGQWNKLKDFYENYEKDGARWMEMLVDQNFHSMVEETLKKLKHLSPYRWWAVSGAPTPYLASQ
jgi:hypothetical protein